MTTLLVLALVFGFYVAWNIGANDVANAMGTSVGSGALTLRRAVILAAILEFCGAFFLGSHVSETIETGVIDPMLLIDSPQVYVFGMLASLLAVGVWLQAASYYGWPVSTTHTIVGALIGFGWLVVGADAIEWGTVAAIVSSWIVSPLIGGVIGYLIFSQIRKRVLYAKKPVAAAKKMTPYLVFCLFCVLFLVLLFDGLLPFNFWEALGLSIVIGLVAALISSLLVRRLTPPDEPSHGFAFEELEMQSRTVEQIFVYLQIMSACFMAFAHGANDVANAMGPLAGVIRVLRTGQITLGNPIPPWVLALGGVGIVVGLATWGWRVIETVGKKITELTPTRGFAAEFGAATTIVVASRIGLPISTTHTLIGAIFGVGMARGMAAINLNVIRDIVVSWVVTIPAGALLAILFYHLLNLFFG